MKLALALPLVAVLLGCSGLTPKSPAQQVADFANAEQCISTHWGEPVAQLATDCLQGEEAAAVDIVADVSLILTAAGVTLPAAYASHPGVQQALAKKRQKPTSMTRFAEHVVATLRERPQPHYAP